MVSEQPRINKTPDCMRDKAIKEIKLMRSAIQVKHAENKQLRNKIKPSEGRETQKPKQSLEENFSQSSLCGFIFNICCTIVDDDPDCFRAVGPKAPATHEGKDTWKFFTTVTPNSTRG